MPAVNQIELHPYFGNSEVDAYGRAHGIATEAWAPIAQGKVLDDPVLNEIGGRLGKSPAQVVLRWHIQRGNIVFPKSTTPARIKENFELFDFQLEPDDVEKIDALDRGEEGRDGPHPDMMAYIPAESSFAPHVARNELVAELAVGDRASAEAAETPAASGRRLRGLAATL